jgi:hypothetical protein
MLQLTKMANRYIFTCNKHASAPHKNASSQKQSLEKKVTGRLQTPGNPQHSACCQTADAQQQCAATMRSNNAQQQRAACWRDNGALIAEFAVTRTDLAPEAV